MKLVGLTKCIYIKLTVNSV